MERNFDKKNFNIHLGGDGLIYATCRTSNKLFVFDGYDWMTFDDFISIDYSTHETVHEDFDDF